MKPPCKWNGSTKLRTKAPEAWIKARRESGLFYESPDFPEDEDDTSILFNKPFLSYSQCRQNIGGGLIDGRHCKSACKEAWYYMAVPKKVNKKTSQKSEHP